ncbi:ABC transporter ATP-binding protein [Glaciihabitans sp. dw_435]|uniref:ABC transporter ATP-binding protein n=1 Tax=Glaciihabitans sp. dw_435 TaxID=2720081 RepID=UPI001BD46B48|nr:ABC transporter ATP-binding protein [Glaciihabitans sp. dw_435]
MTLSSTQNAAAEPILRVQDSTVRFGSVVANDRVSFDLKPGEIHALLGENGAGKTTLMRVLAGLLQPDEGTLFLSGTPTTFHSVADSSAAGIGMVHQHFMLVKTMTVAENVSLGLKSAGRFFPNIARVGRELRALSEQHGLALDPNARVSDLSIGQQQRVEILKTLYRGANILILDEPTAVLTPGETDSLLELLRSLTEQGTSIIFISHKLREIRAIADRVTVLRHGKSISTFSLDQTDDATLTSAMIGRDTAPAVYNATATVRPRLEAVPRLELHGLSVTDRRGHTTLDSISFSVQPGEIFGIAGVDGNGQSELADVLSGVRRASAGSLELDGTDISSLGVAARITSGIAHVPEDRQSTGLILDLSIADNLAMETVGIAPLSKRGTLDRAAVRENALRIISEFDIRCSGPDQAVRELSGGNQQKVLLARAVTRSPRVLIVSQPTRGVDLGAVENIHRQILELAASGCAVVLISTELDEVLALASRVAVIYSGALLATYDRADVDLGTIGMNMAGQAA